MRPDFGFSQRIVFDTSAGWSGNAEETLKGVAQRVDISYLDDAAIDWAQYRWETPEVVIPMGKKRLRPHQAQALEDVFKGCRRSTSSTPETVPAPGDRVVRLGWAQRIVGGLL